MAYRRRKRQAGWGRRRKRQAGWGGRRRRQRGRGPRWEKFKTGVKGVASRAWSKIAPSIVSAGKKNIPRVAGILLSPRGNAHKTKAMTGLAKKFGKDVIRSVVHNVAR